MLQEVRVWMSKLGLEGVYRSRRAHQWKSAMHCRRAIVVGEISPDLRSRDLGERSFSESDVNPEQRSSIVDIINPLCSPARVLRTVRIRLHSENACAAQPGLSRLSPASNTTPPSFFATLRPLQSLHPPPSPPNATLPILCSALTRLPSSTGTSTNLRSNPEMDSSTCLPRVRSRRSIPLRPHRPCLLYSPLPAHIQLRNRSSSGLQDQFPGTTPSSGFHPRGTRPKC